MNGSSTWCQRSDPINPPPNSFGWFSNSIKTDWPPGWPRNMVVLESSRYIDPRDQSWYVQRNDVTDGASTGWLLRRLCPAFVGYYRRAAVFHDRYCQKRTRPSKEVHWMFFEAMRCDGIIHAARIKNRWLRTIAEYRYWAQSWAMWFGVRTFGPRFSGQERAS